MVEHKFQNFFLMELVKLFVLLNICKICNFLRNENITINYQGRHFVIEIVISKVELVIVMNAHLEFILWNFTEFTMCL